MARQRYQGFSGVTALLMQDFGAQPGDLNPSATETPLVSRPSKEVASTVLRGGEYFFMPSLSALKWLGTSTSPGSGHFGRQRNDERQTSRHRSAREAARRAAI